MEIEAEEEENYFYSTKQPSSNTQIMMKVLAGLLNKWDLIIPDNPTLTIDNIKGFFKAQSNNNICAFLLKKLKDKELNFEPNNLLKLKTLLANVVLAEKLEFEQDELMSLLYRAYISIILTHIGLMQKEAPYYQYKILSNECKLLSDGLKMITALETLLNSSK